MTKKVLRGTFWKTWHIQIQIYPQTYIEPKIWCILLKEQIQCPLINFTGPTEQKSSSPFAPLSFGPLKLRPSECWTPQSVHHGVFEQCNCPAFSWRHSYSGLNIHSNPLKFLFSKFFKGNFCKLLGRGTSRGLQ